MAASLPHDTSTREQWMPGPREPQLARGETHVWRADLRIVGEEVLSLLSDGEHERASSIVREPQRQLWGRSRGLLRLLLGRYTASDASAVRLLHGPYGKPELAAADAGGAKPAFNISHSKHLALFAFAAHGAVGIDVQLPPLRAADTATDYVALAKRAFGERAEAPRRQLERQPREREFLRLWTRYEARLKLRGVGVGVGDEAGAGVGAGAGVWTGAGVGTGAEVRAGAGVGDAQTDNEPSIVELDAGPDVAAALACSQAPRRLQLWEWTG